MCRAGRFTKYYDAFGNLAMQANTVTTTEDYFPPVAGRNYVEYSAGTVYLHTNPLGSVGTTTDANGNWLSSEIYDPWGQRWGYTGTLWAERFANLYKRDAENGLDPTQNRMFTSSYGRWLSPDPLAGDVTNSSGDEPGGPQSLNRYAYVMNSPTNLTDPMGLDSTYCPPEDGQCVNIGGGNYVNTGSTIGDPSSAHLGNNWTGTPYNANPGDACAYAASSDASCGAPPGLLPPQPLPVGVMDAGMPSGPLSGDFGAGLGPPPSASSGMPCDFIACGGVAPNAWTAQVGGAVNYTFPFGITVTSFFGLAVDLHGNIGFYWGLGGGAGAGAGLAGGLQAGVSNAHTVCGLRGPFVNASVSGGEGAAGTADIFVGKGNGPGGVVTGVAGTVGLGGGASGSLTGAGTSVVPLRGHC
ncbi:MAG TPA: RHS repeat-associated core domain-containing protein [Terriglobia bacterium]|nr:RHS repeat-associated core domain-containing protein [Terriglobia bacterium]